MTYKSMIHSIFSNLSLSSDDHILDFLRKCNSFGDDTKAKDLYYTFDTPVPLMNSHYRMILNFGNDNMHKFQIGDSILWSSGGCICSIELIISSRFLEGITDEDIECLTNQTFHVSLEEGNVIKRSLEVLQI